MKGKYVYMASIAVSMLCYAYLFYLVVWLLEERVLLTVTGSLIEYFAVLLVGFGATLIAGVFDPEREQDARELFRRNAYKGR